MEVFDITKPRFNEQISPDPWHFVKSRYHSIRLDWENISLVFWIRGRLSEVVAYERW